MPDRVRATPRRRRDGPQPGTHVLPTATAEIVRDLDVPDGWMLLLDGVPNSYLDLADPGRLEFEYMRWFGHLLDLAAEPGRPLRVLHLGGGAAMLARYVAATRPESPQVVVEVNPELVALIRSEFGRPDGYRVVVGDARDVLSGRRDGTADVVIRDAFAGPVVPPHLTSREFVDEVARVLAPGGLYLANVTDGPPLQLIKAEAATARTAFAQVAVVAETPVLRGRRYGNLVLAATTQRPATRTATPRPGAQPSVPPATDLPTADLARLLARLPAPTRLLAGDDLTRFIAGAPPITDAGGPPVPAVRGTDGWRV